MADLPGQLLLLTTLKIISHTDLQAFTHVRGLPARILAQLLQKYILLLGQATKHYAELCSREQPNLEDAVEALQRFGFSPASTLSGNSFHLEEDGYRIDRYRSITLWFVTLSVWETVSCVADRSNLSLKQPTRQYEYQEASDQEVVAIAETDSEESEREEEEVDFHISSSDNDEDAPKAPRVVISKKQKKTRTWADIYKLEREEDQVVLETEWKDVSAIPEYIPRHFPPLPGQEREDLEAAQLLLEQDSLTKAPDSSQALHLRSRQNFNSLSQATHMDPWKHVVTLDRSHLAEKDTNVLQAAFPLVSESTSSQQEESSSLLAFYEAHRDLSFKIIDVGHK